MPKSEKSAYAKRTTDGQEYARDANGELIYYSDDEIRQLGMDPHTYTFTAVDAETGLKVGSAQDEWGALLIVVAQEYRGFGIGPILGQLMRQYDPNYDTGGVTSAGYNNLVRVHRQFVRNALASGQYSKWLRDGTLTSTQIKAILSDANLKSDRVSPEIAKPEQPSGLFSNDPSDWLFAYIHDSIIVYNRKLIDAISTDFADIGDLHEYWKYNTFDEYLVGMIYIGSGAIDANELNIWQFGGKTEEIKKLLMRIGLGHIEVQVPAASVRVLNRIAQYVDESKVQQLHSTYPGEILVKPAGFAPLYKQYVHEFKRERSIRVPNDKFGEISTLIAERAVAKFDDY